MVTQIEHLRLFKLVTNLLFRFQYYTIYTVTLIVLLWFGPNQIISIDIELANAWKLENHTINSLDFSSIIFLLNEFQAIPNDFSYCKIKCTTILWVSIWNESSTSTLVTVRSYTEIESNNFSVVQSSSVTLNQKLKRKKKHSQRSMHVYTKSTETHREEKLVGTLNTTSHNKSGSNKSYSVCAYDFAFWM